MISGTQGLDNHIKEVRNKWSMLFYLGANNDCYCLITIIVNTPTKILIYGGGCMERLSSVSVCQSVSFSATVI